jgi:hypothetical protein
MRIRRRMRKNSSPQVHEANPSRDRERDQFGRRSFRLEDDAEVADFDPLPFQRRAQVVEVGREIAGIA